MDPKGDRLRKIQSGQLKLPESVLKSNNIVLTSSGGGCLEGGARPRAITKEEERSVATSRVPIIIPLKGNNKMPVSTQEIPLPSNADIPLPDAGDIPLPKIDMGNIPLPGSNVSWNKHEEIPLPSNDSIPLPAEKNVSQTTERRRIKVSLSHLEPKGDELLCRSCVMKFNKQNDYDTHLQSDAHQQAIKQSDIQSHGASLLTKRLDKSPSHENKSGHVSFSFKKNYGSRIVNKQPFVQVRRDEKRSSPVEVKLLKPEAERGGVTDEKSTENGNKVESVESGKGGESKGEREGVEEKGVDNKPLMFDFVKVQSKDDSGRVLDWPKEMIRYTVTEPKLMFSCNPLSFDFSQLFPSKKKTVVQTGQDTGIEETTGIEEINEKTEDETKVEESQAQDGDKKKSHKKKKKKHKHKKDKAKDKKENEGDENVENKDESGGSAKKKKKKKHKKKSENKENETSIETVGNAETNEEKDKEKKKHKKSRKKSKQSGDEGDKGEIVDEDKKSKKRKKKKSKKRKKKHHGDSENEKSDGEKENKGTEKGDSGESGKESGSEKKDKEVKKKKKHKKKHKKKESENNESSESDTEKTETINTEISNKLPEKVDPLVPGKRKFPEADSDGESEKIVAKLQALNRTKAAAQKQTVAPTQNIQKKIKKEPEESTEKKTPSDRKRINSESSAHDSTTPVKKTKVTPKSTGLKDNISVAAIAATVINNIKVEKEESWSKIETQTDDNVKSKWDTSDSDMDNALDNTVKKEKVLRKHAASKGAVNKTNLLKELKSPSGITGAKTGIDNRKVLTQTSSQRSNKSNVSAGSAKVLKPVNEKTRRKSRKHSESPASSHSRSRSRSYSHHRSYSRSVSSSRSRSRSYSSSSYYSDDSYHSRHRRSRRSSTRSYSRSSSRSRSRSYRRHRGRSSSYSDYSRSRSYSTSRSRSRSQRRRKRSYSRRRSRSYSTSSYSSRSRSRTRSYRKSRRKTRRKKIISKDRSLSVAPIQKETVAKKKMDKEEKAKEEKEKVDPSNIPLPDLSGKKDDERSEEILQKLMKKKPRTDVGETVAKLVESLPADIPLPFSEGASRTVSSDSLPSGPPTEAPKESDSGFIGPKMPGPPPPPPNMGQRFPPNHGPPGPPRPGYMHGQWDHWEGPGHWEGGPGPWDGHRPPYRGMRPPYEPRMYGPYDPRRRGPPPPYMNRMRGPHPYMGPRYPGPPGPHHDYGYDYGEYDYAEDETQKSNTPPPLPKDPPKESSPKPPLPKKKVKEQEPEQNPDIVIPPEQAEQYKHLQKQAAKHARRQMRRQAKKELGEPDEDSTSSESEPEEVPAEPVVEEEVVDETQTQLVAVPQQVVLQPQPTASPSAAYIIVSGGQQYIVQKPHVVQAGVPFQAGQPVVQVSQGTIMATAAAAAAGAHPAHVVQQVPIGHQFAGHQLAGHQIMAAAPTALSAGVPVAVHSAASVQHLQQVQQLQQLQQIQQIQQFQQAQAIQAHNQAVAAAAVQQGPIIVGNRILVPTLGVRPAM